MLAIFYIIILMKVLSHYRVIDHTADLGIEVFGQDPVSLFENAAEALFDLITDLNRIEPAESRTVLVCGQDWADLMVNWLRELLYMWSAEEKLLGEARLKKLEENRLSATLYLESYTPEKHVIKTEIKAVTYHQIRVWPSSSGWKAQIIFDT